MAKFVYVQSNNAKDGRLTGSSLGEIRLCIYTKCKRGVGDEIKFGEIRFCTKRKNKRPKGGRIKFGDILQCRKGQRVVGVIQGAVWSGDQSLYHTCNSFATFHNKRLYVTVAARTKGKWFKGGETQTEYYSPAILIFM